MKRAFYHVLRCLFLLPLLLASQAHAHKPSDSYLTLRAGADSKDIVVRWDIALRDLDYVLQLDRDNNAELTWGEVRQRADDITRYATSHLQLASQGQDCSWRTGAPLMIDGHSDGAYAVLSLVASCPALGSAVQAHYSLLFDVDPSHRGLVQWVAPGSMASQALIFSTTSATQSLAFAAPGAWQTLSIFFITSALKSINRSALRYRP